MEQSLEDVDLTDQPENWSLNQQRPWCSFPLVCYFSAIRLSVSFCGTDLIPDDQPKYLRVAPARSSNYQQCVEGTKQKLKGWVKLIQKLAGMCPQNFNASAGSLYNRVLLASLVLQPLHEAGGC